MPTLADRLATALAAAGLNPYRLAQISGVTVGTITRALKGERTELTHTTLAAIAKGCAVQLEWLSTGEGPMERTTVMQLRDRQEWKALATAVRAMHPELGQGEIDAVGEMYDHPKIWAGSLDAAAIAALAAIHRDWQAREAARRK